jgi:hypothetical protein
MTITENQARRQEGFGLREAGFGLREAGFGLREAGFRLREAGNTAAQRAGESDARQKPHARPKKGYPVCGDGEMPSGFGRT